MSKKPKFEEKTRNANHTYTANKFAKLRTLLMDVRSPNKCIKKNSQIRNAADGLQMRTSHKFYPFIAFFYYLNPADVWIGYVLREIGIHIPKTTKKNTSLNCSDMNISFTEIALPNFVIACDWRKIYGEADIIRLLHHEGYFVILCKS